MYNNFGILRIFYDFMNTKHWIYEIVWIPNSKKEKKRKKTLDDLPIMLDEDQ